MAWEQRGSSQYYYRKKREGNRVVSKYIGNDLTAQLLSESDQEFREKFLHTQAKWREQKAEFKDMEPDYEFLSEMLRGLVRAIYLTSGYHPYKGQWRKKRRD